MRKHFFAIIASLFSAAAVSAYSFPTTHLLLKDSTGKAKKEKAALPQKQKTAKPAAGNTVTTSPEKKQAAAKPTPVKGSNNISKYQLPFRTWNLTIHGGTAMSATDINYKRFINVSSPKNEFQWYAGLSSTYMWDPAFGVMGKFTAGRLQGVVDSNMDSRSDWINLRAAGINAAGNYFNATFYSGSLSVYWNITNTVFGVNRLIRAQQQGRDMKARWLSLYAHAGIGYTYAQSTLRILNLGEVDHTLTTQGDDGSITFPLGAGLKFKLSKVVDLGLEYNVNLTLTDKLDGFAIASTYRINTDYFHNLGLTLSFKLGSRKRDKEHTEWKHPQESLYGDMARIEKRLDKLYRDSDGDGVSDVFDKEENTPEGIKVYGNGSAVDTDGDGVVDSKDLEPFSDPGAKVNEFGLSADSDGDGVPDTRDLEENSMPGSTVNFQGKNLDTKYADRSKVSDTRGDFFFPSIYFNFNDDNILRHYHDELQSIAKTLRENSGMKLKVVGYCDVKGNDPLNDDLGMRRAKNVVNYLVRVYGFSQAQFEAISKGKRALEKGTDAINRRVDFQAIK